MMILPLAFIRLVDAENLRAGRGFYSSVICPLMKSFIERFSQYGNNSSR
ncbi:hypothetical protein ACLK1Z_22655 [Escherichia coli]